MGNKNTSLNKAKHARSDEFYTSRVDIEEELGHYTEHFRGKTILCNCDDPFKSEFFKYFVLNFNRLGLERLIATCYTDSPKAGRMQPLLVGKDESDKQDCSRRKAYRAIITKVPTNYGDYDTVEHVDMQSLFLDEGNELTELDGNGDFRSPECEALLYDADIVVTNPPFSLFREYMSQLVNHGKKFIILGNINYHHLRGNGLRLSGSGNARYANGLLLLDRLMVCTMSR